MEWKGLSYWVENYSNLFFLVTLSTPDIEEDQIKMGFDMEISLEHLFVEERYLHEKPAKASLHSEGFTQERKRAIFNGSTRN